MAMGTMAQIRPIRNVNGVITIIAPAPVNTPRPPLKPM